MSDEDDEITLDLNLDDLSEDEQLELDWEDEENTDKIYIGDSKMDKEYQIGEYVMFRSDVEKDKYFVGFYAGKFEGEHVVGPYMLVKGPIKVRSLAGQLKHLDFRGKDLTLDQIANCNGDVVIVQKDRMLFPLDSYLENKED